MAIESGGLAIILEKIITYPIFFPRQILVAIQQCGCRMAIEIF